MEYAYSIDLNDYIDAEMAYDYYWSDIIKNKNSFKCPNKLCNATISCANISKDKQDMKQIPNFRGYNHIDGCKHSSKNEKKNESVSDFENSRCDPTVQDTFLLNRRLSEERSNSNQERIPRNKNSEEYSGARYYSIRSLVSKWLSHRYTNTLEDASIRINGNTISYKEMFKGIFKQEILSLPANNRIYWGPAYIDRNDKLPGYIIKFEQEMKSNGLDQRPSFIITDKMIDNYQVKKLIRKRIETIEKDYKNKCFVFIYGHPYSTTKQEKSYINFSIKNLDYMEIRYFDLIEKLKESKAV